MFSILEIKLIDLKKLNEILKETKYFILLKNKYIKPDLEVHLTILEILIIFLQKQ